MKKRLSTLILLTALVLSLVLSACTQPADQPGKDVDPAAVEPVITEYLVKEIGSKHYDKADACIPVVNIFGAKEVENDEVTVFGDFWVENYDIKGDTLECVSGGNYPGIFQLKKDGDTYTVLTFDQVADGSDYTSSAQDLYGDYYDTFSSFSSDDEARNELRTKTIAEYVKAHDLDVTQYQDYGWDPVKLPTE